MAGPHPAAPSALLEQPVFDRRGGLLGRVGAIGTRHGTILHVGIEHGAELQFVAFDRLRVEQDRVVLER